MDSLFEIAWNDTTASPAAITLEQLPAFINSVELHLMKAANLASPPITTDPHIISRMNELILSIHDKKLASAAAARPAGALAVPALSQNTSAASASAPKSPASPTAGPPAAPPTATPSSTPLLSQIVLAKDETLALLNALLVDIKVIDMDSMQAYGDFSDNYDYYQDNYNNVLVKRPGGRTAGAGAGASAAGLAIEFDDELSGPLDEYEYEEDEEVESIMDVMSASPSIYEEDPASSYLRDSLFEINKQHIRIKSKFLTAELLLKDLSEQNAIDFSTLAYLRNANTGVHTRIASLKTELQLLEDLMGVERKLEEDADDTVHDGPHKPRNVAPLAPFVAPKTDEFSGQLEANAARRASGVRAPSAPRDASEPPSDGAVGAIPAGLLPPPSLLPAAPVAVAAAAATGASREPTPAPLAPVLVPIVQDVASPEGTLRWRSPGEGDCVELGNSLREYGGSSSAPVESSTRPSPGASTAGPRAQRAEHHAVAPAGKAPAERTATPTASPSAASPESAAAGATALQHQPSLAPALLGLALLVVVVSSYSMYYTAK